MSTSTFSYAQAAKRSASNQADSQPATSQAGATTPVQGKDDVQASDVSVAAPSVASTEPESRDPVTSSQPEKTAAKNDSEAASVQGSAQSTASVEQNEKAARDANGPSLRSRLDNDDQTSRSTSRASRSNDGEVRRARKGKKGQSSEKDGDPEQAQEKEETPEIPKPVFVEASVPTFNIWAQRREAQAAKVKVAPAPVPAPAPGPAAALAPVPSASSTAQPANATSSGVQAQQGDVSEGLPNGTHEDKDSRKSVDLSAAGDQQGRRNPRGSRLIEKDTKINGPPPLVTDSILFPELKAAQVNGDASRKPSEKTDRPEKESQEDSAPGKRQKEKWKTLDFVPTVNWDTPIPQRAPKPRTARGGREAGATRGGAAAATTSRPAPGANGVDDKAVPSTSPSTAKVAESRPRASSVSTRTPSIPANPVKRESSEVAPGKENRKTGPSQSAEVGDSSGNVQAPPRGKNEHGRQGRFDGSKNIGEGKQFPSSGASSERPHFGAPLVGNNGYPKSTRGGRGAHRGGDRGGHNATAGSHAQAGYATNGQYPVHAFSGRPNGYQSPPYTNGFGPYSTGSNRPPRVDRRLPGAQNGHAPAASGNFVTRVPPTPTGHPFEYGPAPPVFPYSYDVIQMAKAQLEYYFSEENLIRDEWFKRQMDSQGFVPLTLVAGFNRMRSISDIHLLRVACAQSEFIDYVVGDDDVERLRIRDIWGRFVFPIEGRFDEAKHDGPQKYIYRSFHSLDMQYPPPQPQAAPMYQPAHDMYTPSYPPIEHVHGAGYVNGMANGDVNGYHQASGSQLSAAVPEFSPVSAVPLVRLEDLTNFKDEDIKTLMLVTRPKLPNKTHGDLANDSVEIPPVLNGSADLTAFDSTDTAASEAGSSSVNGTACTNGMDESRSTGRVFWVNGEQPGPTLNIKGGGAAEPYLPFREQALEERRLAAPGETPKKMKHLYLFWLQFLTDNFNEKMYLEFRNLALEDARQSVPRKYGLSQLLQYFNVLLSEKPTPKPWGKEVLATPHIIVLHAMEARDLDIAPANVAEN